MIREDKTKAKCWFLRLFLILNSGFLVVQNQVTLLTPPAFLVHSVDDETVSIHKSIDYLLAVQKNKVPCELHLYEKAA